MAPKKGQPSPAAVPASAARPQQATTSASGQPTKPQNKPSPSSTSSSNTTSSSAGAGSSVRNAQDAQQIALGMWNNYVDKTPQRVKLLDAFIAFLLTVGALQFVYCVIAGNYVRAILTIRGWCGDVLVLMVN